MHSLSLFYSRSLNGSDAGRLRQDLSYEPPPPCGADPRPMEVVSKPSSFFKALCFKIFDRRASFPFQTVSGRPYVSGTVHEPPILRDLPQPSLRNTSGGSLRGPHALQVFKPCCLRSRKEPEILRSFPRVRNGFPEIDTIQLSPSTKY